MREMSNYSDIRVAQRRAINQLEKTAQSFTLRSHSSTLPVKDDIVIGVGKDELLAIHSNSSSSTALRRVQ